MIADLIKIIEDLNINTIPALTSLYSDDAIFVHPLKTVTGPAAISRQWKMSLKLCPGTKMTITRVVQNDTNVFSLDWVHHFDAGSVDGNTIVVLNEPHTKIIHQIDTFNVGYLFSLFDK